MSEQKPKKPSTVRHTRAIQRDRRTRPAVAPSVPQVEDRLAELIHPATLAQVAAFHDRGLRERSLTLPVMVAFALSLIWRQLGSVSEAIRVLTTEGVLWVEPLAVSQQAVSQRLRRFPAVLFERVLLDVLPRMHARRQARRRPLPPALARARDRFTAVVTLDGSTLDVLLRRVGLLREADKAPLAGRMVATLAPGTLLPFDLGFLNYGHFDELTERGVSFLTRVAANAADRTERALHATADRHHLLVRLGSREGHRCAHAMRLVEVQHRGRWFRYLTNVTDPQRLPPDDVVALYGARWRVEDAFNAVKRLLGLAYFWTGALNGVMVQVWATWLLYAVLVDLTDVVAEALAQKHRSSVAAMARKYRARATTPHGTLKCFQVVVEREGGQQPLVARFRGIPLRRRTEAVLVDQAPSYRRFDRVELVQRLLADECELCGSTDNVQVHHIRKLAGLTPRGRK